MFNCSGCWDSPCRCGKEYQDWSIKDLQDQIKMLEEVIRKKHRKNMAKRGVPWESAPKRLVTTFTPVTNGEKRHWCIRPFCTRAAAFIMNTGIATTFICDFHARKAGKGQ